MTRKRLDESSDKEPLRQSHLHCVGIPGSPKDVSLVRDRGSGRNKEAYVFNVKSDDVLDKMYADRPVICCNCVIICR